MKTTPTKRSAKAQPLPDPAHCLYQAVRAYIKTKGGNVVAAGGIEIHSDPTSNFRFKVAVLCTGIKPTPAKKTKAL